MRENIAHNCLFCAAETFPISQSSLIVNEDGERERVTVKMEDGLAEGSGLGWICTSSTDIIIQNDLRSIFIVRKLLELPENKCQQYLQWETEGCHNPGSWLAVCGKCNESVRECYQNYQKIVRLEEKLRKVKAELQSQIRDSCDKNQSTNCGISDDIRRTTLLITDLPVKEEKVADQREKESWLVSALLLNVGNCHRKLRTRTRERCSVKIKDVIPTRMRRKRGSKRKTSNVFLTETVADEKTSDLSVPEPENEFFSLNSFSLGTGDAPWDLENENMQWAASPLSRCGGEEEDDPDWMPQEAPFQEEDEIRSNRSRKRSKAKLVVEDDKDNDADWTPSEIHCPETEEGEPFHKRKGRGRKKKVQLHEQQQDIFESNGNAKNSDGVKLETLEGTATPDDNDKYAAVQPQTESVCEKKDVPASTTKIKTPKRAIPAINYKCDKCPAIYPLESQCRKHEQLHINNTGTKCPYCGWLCVEKFLSNHIGSRHSTRKKNKTKKPVKVFKNIYKREVRAINEETELPYYCDHCHMIFKSKQALTQHVPKGHPEKPLASCEKCKLKFISKQLLQLHVSKAHPEIKPTTSNAVESNPNDDEPQTCPHCQEVFISKLKVDYHIAVKHSDILLKCKLCGYQALKPSLLLQHIEKKHESPKYICEVCAQVFSCPSGLKYHMKQYHYQMLGVEPFECPECGRTFPYERALQSHVDHVHKKMKTLCCEHCGKAFARKCDLQKHILLHTVPRELQYKKGPFICKFCQAKFNVRQGLYYHMKKDHSDKYAFQCGKCGKGYAVRPMLVEHENNCKGSG